MPPKLIPTLIDDAAQMAANLGIGNYHSPNGYSFGSVTIAIVPDTLYAVLDTREIVAAKIGMAVTTLGAGLVRLGYYDSDAQGRPGKLVEELTAASAIDISSTGIKNKALAAPGVRLRARRWLVMLSNVAFTARGMTGSNASLHNLYGSPDITSTTAYSHITVAQAYGALPAVFPSGFALVASGTAPSFFYGETP